MRLGRSGDGFMVSISAFDFWAGRVIGDTHHLIMSESQGLAFKCRRLFPVEVPHRRVQVRDMG